MRDALVHVSTCTGRPSEGQRLLLAAERIVVVEPAGPPLDGFDEGEQSRVADVLLRS